MRLGGKVALISGGARGQGAAEARLFAREGASVVIGDVLVAPGREVEAEINKAGGNAVFVRLDVRKESDWRNAIEMAVERFGKLDILVKNAAIYLTVPLEHTTEEEWDEAMEINAKGVFLGTKHAIPAMRRAGGGSIINISSMGGLAAIGPGGAYAVSKGGVRLLTKHTAIQHAREGIRANAVYPGPIETEMFASSTPTSEGRAATIALVPLGRIGTVEEVAYGALFLASDESSYVTGADLVIDDGVTAQ